MEGDIVTGIKHCSKCTTYHELCEAFDARVRPLLEKVLQLPLTKLPREHVALDECNNAVAQLREQLSRNDAVRDDVWLLFYRCAGALLERLSRKRVREGSIGASHLTTVVTNCFIFFCFRGLPDVKHISLYFGFLKREKSLYEASDAYVHANASERRKLQLNSVLAMFSERAHRHHFSTVWMHCIEHASDAALHVHLLNILGTTVLPNLTNPVVVADYLSGCFSSGGLISILALQGLLVLMLDHGLEYPQFYEQLYSLITADAFTSRHRYDLFRLLDLAMTSLRVPSYVAASVIKKVAFVSLTAPSPTLYFSLPFIRKLLQNHTNCLALIHRRSREAILPDNIGDHTSTSALTAKKEAMSQTADLFNGVDPFDAAAPLAQSHALNSTLWELTALERHFLPTIPLMVSAFSSVAEDKKPLKFEKTYARLFTSEVTRAIDRTHLPPVAYREPTKSEEGEVVTL